MDNQSLISVKSLLQKSLVFYREKFFMVSALLLVNLPWIVFYGWKGDAIEPMLFTREEMFAAVIIGLVIVIPGVLVSLWSNLSVMLFAASRETAFDPKRFLKLGWGKLVSYLWTSFLAGIITIGYFLLLIIPGIIVSVRFALFPYVFASEGLTGKRALDRSKELVKGIWWKIFWRLLAFMLLVMLVSMVTGWMPLIGGLIELFFITPLCIIYGYFLYEDVKRVKSQTIA